MLVLSRAEGEQIIIGQPGDVLRQPIVIQVVRREQNDRLRLGVECQRDMQVHRAEVLQRINEEKNNADS